MIDPLPSRRSRELTSPTARFADSQTARLAPRKNTRRRAGRIGTRPRQTRRSLPLARAGSICSLVICHNLRVTASGTGGRLANVSASWSPANPCLRSTASAQIASPPATPPDSSACQVARHESCRHPRSSRPVESHTYRWQTACHAPHSPPTIRSVVPAVPKIAAGRPRSPTPIACQRQAPCDRAATELRFGTPATTASCQLAAANSTNCRARFGMIANHGQAVCGRNRDLHARRLDHRPDAAKFGPVGMAETEHAEVQPARRTNVNNSSHRRAVSARASGASCSRR